MEKAKAIFLDRDGTLVEEVDFLSTVDDLRVFPFAFEAVKRLKGAGFRIIVITNQSGIGRGRFTEDAMHEIHEEIQAQLDGMIDAFYFCPHLPDEGCTCRKPGTGMIDSACADFTIDLENSWMIGDKSIDIGTAANARLNAILVRTGYGAADEISIDAGRTQVADDLLDSLRFILHEPSA